jgi:TonB family protein
LVLAGSAVVVLAVVLAGAMMLLRTSKPTTPAASPGAASAVASAPSSGTMQVESQPEGAAVIVNGEPRGLTPLVLNGLAWGRYQIEIAKSGHEPQSSAVELAAAAPRASVKVELKPLGGATTRDIYTEQEIDAPMQQVGGSPVAFPPNVPGPAPGQSLSVAVSFTVMEDGGVTGVQVQESGGTALDQAVTQAVSAWKFTPATKGGAKVKALLRRRFTFRSS